MRIETEKLDLARRIQSLLDAECYVVGGFVRDLIIGEESKDLDIEVYGLTYNEILNKLQPHFKLNVVGKSFGVMKLHDHNVDVSIPRFERKTGDKHQDFLITCAPTITPFEASLRRDFTMNALMLRVSDGEVLDFHNGLEHLKSGVLEVTSERFSEDPLRVLRAAQFIARFDLMPSQALIDSGRSLSYQDISKERIEEELKKLILKGKHIGKGLRFLRDVGWLFPELQALVGCPQDPKHHPEGDAFEHTCLVMDHFSTFPVTDKTDRWVLGLACLCHDLGKPYTTEITAEGRLTSYGHDEAGVGPSRAFLSRFTQQADVIDQVVLLVQEHMKPFLLFQAKSGRTPVRRLVHKVKRVDLLTLLTEADSNGRLVERETEFLEWFKKKLEELGLDKSVVVPLITGKMMLHLSSEEGSVFQGKFQPGKALGDFLRSCFEDQLDGKFDKNTLLDYLKGR